MKTPEERGPLGAWAYDSRVRLGLSVEQVALALPSKPNPATLRKAEASTDDMSRPLWRAVTTYYRELAAGRPDVTLDPLPTFGDAPEPPSNDIIAAIDRQTEAIKQQSAILMAVLLQLGDGTMSPEMERFLQQAGAPIPSLPQPSDHTR